MNSFNDRAESAVFEHNQRREQRPLESPFLIPMRHTQLILRRWRGLVISPNDEIRQRLAEALRDCGLIPIIASSAAESRILLDRYKVRMVFCDESVADGGYHAVIEIVNRKDRGLPVIVISRTGDWPEYLAATRDGAFDYLAYPPVPGELTRVIRHAFLAPPHQQDTAAMEAHSTLRIGERQ